MELHKKEEEEKLAKGRRTSDKATTNPLSRRLSDEKD